MLRVNVSILKLHLTKSTFLSRFCDDDDEPALEQTNQREREREREREEEEESVKKLKWINGSERLSWRMLLLLSLFRCNETLLETFC